VHCVCTVYFWCGVLKTIPCWWYIGLKRVSVNQTLPRKWQRPYSLLGLYNFYFYFKLKRHIFNVIRKQTRAGWTGWCSPNRGWTQARNFVISIWWSFLWNGFEIRLQKMKLWAGHHYAARSCLDIDLQGSDPNVVRDTSSQYGDHFCEIVLKSDFK